MRWAPHDYQKKAIKRGLAEAALGLFLDPGLGKTSITLSIIKILMAKKLVNKVLVVAPLRVAASTWPAERDKWLDFADLKMVVLHGSRKDALLQTDADIYVINPEGLEWLMQPTKVRHGNKVSVQVDVRRFKELGFDMLVVDELTMFKNAQSIRFKSIKLVLGTFRRRYGLTGTPAANGLLDLFGQIYVLDEGNALGRFITHFREKFFTPHPNGFDYIVQPDGEERIYKAIAPVTLRLAAADYLKLPLLVENIIELDMPPSAREVYDALEDDLLVELAGSGAGATLTAKNAGVALGKCRQVTSGAIYKEAALGELLKTHKRGDRDWILLHDAKIDALQEIVDELQGAPLLVVYEFHHDLERIQEKFGTKKNPVPYIGAGVSVSNGRLIQDQWNRGELPILAVHPVSVAHGLNLQESGQHIVWFTLTWNYELFTQLIDRLRRQGSVNERIFCHVLLMKGTIEEDVLKALRSKRDGQNALFTALKALAKGRQMPARA